jgi:hypothetical protein
MCERYWQQEGHMGSEGKQQVRRALFETIENQIREGNPKETRATFDRLVREGYTADDAMRLIALVLVGEMNTMLRTNRPFNQARYIKALKDLPKLA